MRKVSLIASKGGSAKSTACRHLAVAALQAGYRSAILDTDPQETLRDWGRRRKREPLVTGETSVRLESIDEALQAQEQAGVEMLFIDTAGHMSSSVPLIAARSDLVLVPVRPTPEDMDAITLTVRTLQGREVPYFVFVSQAPTNTSKPRDWAFNRLVKMKVPVLDTVIHARSIVYTSSATGGTVLELEGLAKHEEKAADEFRALFQAVERELGKKATKPYSKPAIVQYSHTAV